MLQCYPMKRLLFKEGYLKSYWKSNKKTTFLKVVNKHYYLHVPQRL